MRFHHSGLSWRFLFEATAGHVQPAQQLTYWLVARNAPFDWGTIATGILTAELLTVVVMWHLLSRLLPGRWVRVPLLAVFAWSPITLVPTLWWSAAMGLWPPMLFLLLAALFFVRAQQRAGNVAVDLIACLLAIVAGLAWHERGVLAIAVVAGVAIARSPRTGWRRIHHAVRRWWVLWVPLAVMTGGYLVLHQALTSVGPQQASAESWFAIIRAFVLRNTVPGLASGPWSADVLGGAIAPARWVEVLAALLAVAAAICLARLGGPSRGAALLMLAAYVAGDALLLLLGRAGFGEIIALDPRYTADVVAAAVLFAAIALEGAPSRPPIPRMPVVAGAAALLYLGGAAVTTGQLAGHFENHDDRRFVTNLRAALARDPDQVLLDRLAPPDILLPLLGKEALLSEVLAPLPEHPVFDVPSPKLRQVTDDGHLAEVRIVPVGTSAPGPDGECGHAVATGETVIPLEFSAPLSGRVVFRLQAFINRAADFDVRVGTWTGRIHVIRGPQDIWLVVPADAEPYSSVSLTGAGTGTLCVVRVDVGPPLDEP